MTKNDCQLYNYSLKYFKRIVKESLGSFYDEIDSNNNYIYKPGGRLEFARKFSSWQEYKAAVIANDDAYVEGEPWNNLRPAGCEDDDSLRKYWIFANTRFCDLSQAMKAWVINDSLFFCGSKPDQDAGMFCMAYGDPEGISNTQSEMEQMKVMSENKAIGVCHDYAKYEVTVFNQLGIKAVYDRDGGHAWSVVYPTNADGKKLKYIFSYSLKYDNESSYGKCSSESDIY